MSEFDYRIVSDPEIFQQNRLPAHADFPYFEKAEPTFGEESDCRQSLNGIWKFAYADNYAEAIKGFEQPDYDVQDWAEIKVPGHIQTQGYDHPAYVNTQYPWDGHEQIRPGQVPTLHNPTASYVTTFTVPKQAQGRALFISFQGAESGLALWLNGHYVGYSEDSFTPSEFELTPYLVPGENRLAAQVFKWTAGSWGESQDFFRFSGIFRDVYLYWKPQAHVEDLRIRTALAEDLTSAQVQVRARTNANGHIAAALTFDGELAAEVQAEVESGTDTDLIMPIAMPRLWSAEQPNLYALRISVFDAAGKQQETVLEQVGIRHFAIKDSVMYLNGKRIVFYGVDRHEFGNVDGRCLDPQDTWKDLLTMKRNNINAVRTSHYPNANAFYRMCDQLGLYVIDEGNFESHGAWDAIARGLEDLSFAIPGNRPEFLELIKDRIRSMYERDKNRPCVLIWSLGNESLNGLDFLECTKMLHEMDPGRPVHYEGVCHDRRYNDTTDIESTMYTTVEDIKTYLAEHRDKPYILCEYSHAMGNSCGAIHKYMDLTEEEMLFQGGFIWDYIDQCMTKTDRYGRTFQGYGGDFGERPTDYNFSGNGIVYGENREPSPKMQEVKTAYQSIKVSFVGAKGTLAGQTYDRFYQTEARGITGGPQVLMLSDEPMQIELWNKFLFTDLADFDAEATLARDGQIVQSAPLSVVCPPQEKVRIELPLLWPEEAGEYTVTVSFTLKADTAWAKAGHEIAWGQAVLVQGEVDGKGRAEALALAQADSQSELIGKELPESGWSKSADGELHVIRGWHNTGVRGRDFEVLFSDIHGGLVSYKYQGRQILEDIPKPNVWRAPTDNDVANLLAMRAGAWKAASQYVTCKEKAGRGMTGYTVEEEKDVVKITYTYHLTEQPFCDCKVRYEVHADGWIGVNVTLDESAAVGQLPELSMLFTLPADCHRLSWYGLGEEETYIDRCHAKLGFYENNVADNMAKYLRPQECGSKVGVRAAKLTDDAGHGIMFDAEGLQLSALPYTPQMLENARHPQELPLPLYTYVRIGLQQGVGGDDTWGAPVHTEYLLDNHKKLELHFSFKGM